MTGTEPHGDVAMGTVSSEQATVFILLLLVTFLNFGKYQCNLESVDVNAT